MWVQFLPKEQRGLLRYAFNGDFELPPSSLPFDWVLPNNPGANVEIIESAEPDHGHVLHAEFGNTRAETLLAMKTMILTPGRYRLSGSVKAQEIQSERGLVWRIACIAQSGEIIAETPHIKGTVAWQSFSADFAVSEENCRAQMMRLEIDARVSLESQISGDAWYDNLAIERLPATRRRREILGAEWPRARRSASRPVVL